MNVLSEHLITSLKNQYTLLMKKNKKKLKYKYKSAPGLKEDDLFRMIRLHMKEIANTMGNETNHSLNPISMRAQFQTKSYSSDFALDDIHFSGSGSIRMRSPSSFSPPAPQYSNSPSKTGTDSIDSHNYETMNSPYDSDDDNESKLNYSESSTSSDEDYDEDYSCSDSEDSFYGLTEQETYEKLIRKWAGSSPPQEMVTDIPDIDHNANSEPVIDIMDSVIFLQNTHGRFQTVIIKQPRITQSEIGSKKENNNDNNCALSLDDVERIFCNKIKHHPQNIKQLLAFCQQNNYKFGYKTIKTWWINRNN